MMVIGADEVGSGDIFCGLVVSAVSITEEQERVLRSRRVRDSKKISNSMIGQYVALMTEVGVRHSTVALDPKTFNALLSERGDHVQIQNELYNRAIRNLITKVGTPDRILVDQFPGARIRVDHQEIELLPRADEKYIPVAAASIMARSAYLGMRKALGRQLGMRIPLGTSAAKEALRALITRDVDISRYAKTYPNNVRALLQEVSR